MTLPGSVNRTRFRRFGSLQQLGHTTDHDRPQPDYGDGVAEPGIPLNPEPHPGDKQYQSVDKCPETKVAGWFLGCCHDDWSLQVLVSPTSKSNT